MVLSVLVKPFFPTDGTSSKDQEILLQILQKASNA